MHILGTLVVVTAVLLFMFTQVVMPAFTDQDYFSLFTRKGEKRVVKATNELKDVDAHSVADAIEEIIEQTKPQGEQNDEQE